VSDVSVFTLTVAPGDLLELAACEVETGDFVLLLSAAAGLTADG